MLVALPVCGQEGQRPVWAPQNLPPLVRGPATAISESPLLLSDPKPVPEARITGSWEQPRSQTNALGSGEMENGK